MAIEPRIRPLVDALNATGLVQTFTSCEGHFADGASQPSPDRERANVGFFLSAGAPEQELARLFGAMLAEQQRSEPTEAELAIAKRYLPSLDGTDVAEVFFEVTIRPSRSLQTSAEAKRAATDRCLAVVVAAVERWSTLGSEGARAGVEAVGASRGPGTQRPLAA